MLRGGWLGCRRDERVSHAVCRRRAIALPKRLFDKIVWEIRDACNKNVRSLRWIVVAFFFGPILHRPRLQRRGFWQDLREMRHRGVL